MTTMIAAIRRDGSTACMTIDGATGTEVFEAYGREVAGTMLRLGVSFQEVVPPSPA